MKRGSSAITASIAKLAGERVQSDALNLRVIGALIGAGIIAGTLLAIPDELRWLPLDFVAIYAGIVLAIACVPSAHFVVGQTVAAVATYGVLRYFEPHTWEDLAWLGAQQLVFWLLLWRAPLGKLGMRQLLIAAATLALIPVYYWGLTKRGMDPELMLGSLRQFVLLVVLMASLQRSALTAARNLTLAFCSPIPIPLEKADEPDRRLVTAVEGGIFFALGLAMIAAFHAMRGKVNGVGPIDWSADRPEVVLAILLVIPAYMLYTGGVGFILMGHAHLLGIRVVAPIASPHRFTNFNETWRGANVYLYRFAYDGYYRQFFGGGSATQAAWKLVGSITIVFLAMAYLHFPWGGAKTSPTAIALWTIQGIVTGLTLLYLRNQAKARLAKYRAKQAAPKPSRTLVPVFILLVLLFRGLTDYGISDRNFIEHVQHLLGL